MALNKDIEGYYQIIRLPDKPKAWCVKVLKGPWKDIVYTYGRISFEEKDEKLMLKMEHEVLFVPEKKRKKLTEKQYKEWETFIGKVAVNIIDENAGDFDISDDKLTLSKGYDEAE